MTNCRQASPLLAFKSWKNWIFNHTRHYRTYSQSGLGLGFHLWSVANIVSCSSIQVILLFDYFLFIFLNYVFYFLQLHKSKRGLFLFYNSNQVKRNTTENKPGKFSVGEIHASDMSSISNSIRAVTVRPCESFHKHIPSRKFVLKVCWALWTKS